MPIDISKAPSTLPESGKQLYVEAWNNAYSGTCKDEGDRRDECSSKIAWSVVKSKFSEGADGKWTPKAEVQEFSMAITRTSYDKLTNERHWKAVASDTEDDLYKDNMTLELFSDFLERIETKEQPPEEFRSEFWSGGKPYLSISHYPDFNGKGVPGPVDAVYIDGRVDAGRGKLKAKGRFDDTPIGKACFQSVSRDIEEKTPDDEKIRISIAFLDYLHRHKSTGYEFERTEDDSLCPECLKELITGDYGGKEFLSGHLIHLGMTRVPVNQRTDMEVERSMTTKLEDAASIVGEELAEELEEEAKKATVGKSEALVIKAEDEPVEKAKDKKKEMDEEEDEEKDDKDKKKKKEEKSDAAPEFEEKALHLLGEINDLLTPQEVPAHLLDVRMDAVKEAYDQALEMEDSQLALQSVNEPFEELARSIQEGLAKEDELTEPVTEDKALADAISTMTQQLALLNAKVDAIEANPQQIVAAQIPERRSVNTPEIFAQPQEEKSETPGLQNLVRKGMGLEPINQG
jgi:cation transport regulator ChaB